MVTFSNYFRGPESAFRLILDKDLDEVLGGELKIFAQLHSTQANKMLGVLASVMKRQKDIAAYKLNPISGRFQVCFLYKMADYKWGILTRPKIFHTKASLGV